MYFNATGTALDKYYLGTGTSLNIKTKLPELYDELTAADFLLIPTNISANAGTNISVMANNYSYAKTMSISCNTNIKPTVNYNPSTGMLTTSNLTNTGTNSYNDKDGEGRGMSASASVNVTISYDIYLVPGMKDAITK